MLAIEICMFCAVHHSTHLPYSCLIFTKFVLWYDSCLKYLLCVWYLCYCLQDHEELIEVVNVLLLLLHNQERVLNVKMCECLLKGLSDVCDIHRDCFEWCRRSMNINNALLFLPHYMVACTLKVSREHELKFKLAIRRVVLVKVFACLDRLPRVWGPKCAL